jgi:hypothetical protein
MLDRLTLYLFDHKRQTRELGWFRLALYLFLLYKVCVYIIHFDDFFKSTGLIFHRMQNVNPAMDFAFYLCNHYSVHFAAICILAVCFLSLLGFGKRSNYMTNAILWLLIMNITNVLYPTLTAGDYLLNQVLFFNIFFSFKDASGKRFHDLKTMLHNTALIGIKVQVCIAYFLAGWFKLIDPSWIGGEALSQIFRIPEFSNELLMALPAFICTLLTYCIIVYQLLFPLLIWIRPLKIYVLAFGILQHLMIAFGMGLFGFGILMIICYILFLKVDTSRTFNKQGSNSQ